jgi:N-acetylmuramoyl-L-alanine amidase
MRTTVDLDMQVLQEAKQRAAERHTTLSVIVEEALREAAARRRHAVPAGRVTLTTDPGHGGVRPGVDLADNAALRDLLDGDDDSL